MKPDDSDPAFRRTQMMLMRGFVEHFLRNGPVADLLDAYKDHGIGKFSYEFLRAVDSDPGSVPVPVDLRERLSHAAAAYEVLGT